MKATSLLHEIGGKKLAKVKWGIISSAQIAIDQVIPAIKSSHNGEVYAISSGSGKEKDVAKQFSIPNTYDDHEKLLDDPEIDAVYIPLPNSLHKEWCVKAARKGKHILCEKPIALSENQLFDIIQACEENHVYFMEAYMYRFHSQHKLVKEMLEEGKIGDILSIHSVFHFTIDQLKKDIRMQAELGGGVTYDIGGYSVNVINYLLDSSPSTVYATALYEDVDTKITAVLEYENQITATIDSSFYGPMLHAYKIIGTKGVIEVPYAFRPDLNDDDGVIIIRNQTEEILHVKEKQYVNEVEHFAEVIQGKAVLDYTPSEVHRTLKTLEAIQQSAIKKRQVIL